MIVRESDERSLGHQEYHGRLRLIFDAPDLTTARRLMEDVIRNYAQPALKAIEQLEALKTLWQ